jgi:hypothetical protein
MTDVGSPVPSIDAPKDPGVPRSPFPKRLILAGLALFLASGVTGLLALIAGYAASLSYAPLSPVLGLAGPAAALMFVAAILILARNRWAQPLTAISGLYGIVLGIVLGSSGWLAIICFLAIGLIVGSVDPGVFPGGAMLPPTRVGKVVVAAVGLGLVVVATPLLLADPLKPADVRSPAWAGVIASGERRELTDSRRFGQPAEVLEGGLVDGDLVVAGGSVDAPTWAWSLSSVEGDPGCFKTRDFGYDDGPTVVILVSRSGADVGIRVMKAPGFEAPPVTDGRYVGAVPSLTDTRLAAAGTPAGPALDIPWTLPPAGYFCLDANGHATRWDRGY